MYYFLSFASGEAVFIGGLCKVGASRWTDRKPFIFSKKPRKDSAFFWEITLERRQFFWVLNK